MFNNLTKNALNTKKPQCFFCKYEIRTKPRLMNYKNTTIKVCKTCNSGKNKVCSKKYNSKLIDCSICKKAVLYNSSILCSNCDHFVHKKCTVLSTDDIKNIENTIDTWFCPICVADCSPSPNLVPVN